MQAAFTATRTILIVDDEPAVAETMRASLAASGFHDVHICADSARAQSEIERLDPALVLLDLNMPAPSGEQILAAACARRPDLPVVVVTGESEVATAVRCMRLGAADYLLKPAYGELLAATVQRCLEDSALRWEAAHLRRTYFAEDLLAPAAFRGILTEDAGMHRLFAFVEAVARGSQPVLIRGETGTGKELFARALHDIGRPGRPFVAVNAAGLDDALFADALFGHVVGSFTGATAARPGMVAQAADGTLFLDEIGELAEASQVKLLRLIQEREYTPVGSDAAQPLRARIVAATHRDPQRLREDLYYRLRVYELRVPPLRERRGDLPLLFEHFVARAARDLARATPRVPEELFLHLCDHPLPGNARQLGSLAHAAVARCTGDVLNVASVLEELGSERLAVPAAAPPGLAFPQPMPSMAAIERAAVTEALRRSSGNQSAAARMLQLSRPTVARLGKSVSGDRLPIP